MQPFEISHIEKLRSYLPECMVLLKCNGAFPLEKPCRIAAFGDGVRNTVKGGTGSGEVNSRYFVTVEQGLEQAGFTITNKDWPDQYAVFLERAKRDFRSSVKRKAKEEHVNVIAASMGAVLKQPEYEIDLDYSADAAVYVVSRLSGEGNDRLPEKGDFELTDSEARDILALDESYERFLLVVNAGGPVDLTPVMDVGNIMVMSQLGVETGAALADVMLGKAYPSGKLSTTWAAYGDYCQIGDFAQRDDTHYREGIFVGYRYFDAVQNKPLFPFGFGLGYTTFEISEASCLSSGSLVSVKAHVANTGEFAGKETVQVYASCPRGKLVREVKSLAGFAKTRELCPGESATVEIEFDVRDFAGYDEDGACFILEAGVYVLFVGTSSENATPCAYFSLQHDHIVKQVRGKSVYSEEIDYRESIASQAVDSCEELPFDEGALETRAVSYELPNVEIPELNLLSDEDLAYLNMGAFNPKGGLASVIGNASQSVAGAAGESTSQLEDMGIDSLVMADGPAGLRLAREFYRDEKGVHSIGFSLPESIIEALPRPVKWLLMRKPRLKKGVVIEEQFTTALPIATAIAQSFNLEFAELCGDIVGSEMDVFGVDLWLAPALNIHRNVLCGRNFEYFSEDPLVSGKFAAAVTRGVQRHAGRGVTIKHFAANNQETNRYANNSVVSGRALREIYLKGFEICIRESSPKALMTSYNLVNGTHTSESRELTEILRCEFGFDGIIMTDWLVGGDFLTGDSKYAQPDPAKVAAAGCSLYMPGSKKDHDALLAGLRSGVVTREQLVDNASRFLRVAWTMQAALRM